MKNDCLAVAGFFEDLPVLAFVLSGVMSLILTGTFVARHLEVERNQEHLDDLAQRIVDSLAGRICLSRGTESLPTVVALIAWNYSAIFRDLCEGHGYLFTVNSVHPSPEELIRACSDSRDTPESTGHAVRFVNALDARNLRIVLEANILVW